MIINKETINKVLIIKPRGIGDLILSTIVLKNLKADFPYCKIHFLTESFAAPILKFNPYIDKVFEFEKSISKNIKLIFKLNKERYDLILDFYSNPRTAQFTFLINSKIKVGYGRRGRNYAYNYKVKIVDENLHSALAHLEFLKLLGIRTEFREVLYFISEEEKQFANNFFEINKLNEEYIAILPGGGWNSKRCEPEKFSEICYAIYNKFGFKFLILYGNEDKSDAQKIYDYTREISYLGPETSIREMVALISKCIAVIANDSGPMHLAATIGIPTLGIFGPTNPYAHGPFGEKCDWVRYDELNCIQCNLRECPQKHECMNDLSTEKVVKKFENILGLT